MNAYHIPNHGWVALAAVVYIGELNGIEGHYYWDVSYKEWTKMIDIGYGEDFEIKHKEQARAVYFDFLAAWKAAHEAKP